MKGQSLDDKRHKRLGFHGSQGGFQHIYGGRFRFGSRLDKFVDVNAPDAKVEEQNIPETDAKTEQIEEDDRLKNGEDIK